MENDVECRLENASSFSNEDDDSSSGSLLCYLKI